MSTSLMSPRITVVGPPEWGLEDTSFPSQAAQLLVVPHGRDSVLVEALASDITLGVLFAPNTSTVDLDCLKLAASHGRRVVMSPQQVRANIDAVVDIAPLLDVLICIEYDEIVVQSVEHALQDLVVVAALYLAVGVETTGSLVDTTAEGELFPDWDYFTKSSARRIADKYACHWGGNLPFDEPEWMTDFFPHNSAGFFVACDEAFEQGSYANTLLHTVRRTAISGALEQLKAVANNMTVQ